jgi:serine/threonine protein kinase
LQNYSTQVRSILNVKGTLRLNKLQKHIEFFVCASRGIPCDSSQADAPILSRIGAVDPVQLSEHQVDEFSHVHMSLDDDGTVMTGSGRSKRKQSYADMATEDHGSIIEVLKHDNIMDQSCDEGCIQNEFFNNILVTGKVKLSDGRFGASIYRGKLMDKRIRPSIHSVGSEEWQNESSAFIALKVASSDNSNEANEVIEELRREGRVAKELHHDNICRLLDTFETPG